TQVSDSNSDAQASDNSTKLTNSSLNNVTIFDSGGVSYIVSLGSMGTILPVILLGLFLWWISQFQ
ncbi:hypothetical protein ACJMK2_018691, partial [Sinanodonta woodiana]